MTIGPILDVLTIPSVSQPVLWFHCNPCFLLARNSLSAILDVNHLLPKLIGFVVCP